MTKCIKTFYGKTSIDSIELENFQDMRKIELEYYQIQNNTSDRPYGIEIVKKQVENNQINIENKEIKNICIKEQDTNKLLELLVSNKVTPISVEYIIQDLIKANAI